MTVHIIAITETKNLARTSPKYYQGVEERITGGIIQEPYFGKKLTSIRFNSEDEANNQINYFERAMQAGMIPEIELGVIRR
tara:strand:+ start:7610 stop:7852 length:243 start_codon:yes stop_codon:yes gene_type:complete